MRLVAPTFLTLCLLLTPAQAADVDQILDEQAETTITATKDGESRKISTCRDYFELTGNQGWEVPFEADDAAPTVDFEVNCALNLFVAQHGTADAESNDAFTDVARFSSEFGCIAAGCDEPPEALGQNVQITIGGFSTNGINFEISELHYGNFTGEDRPEAMVKLKWWQDGETIHQSALAVLYEQNGIIRLMLVRTTNALQEKPEFENN